MAAIVTPRGSVHSQASIPEILSEAQIQKMIGAIPAEQIASIGKAIAIDCMDYLCIDPPQTRDTGRLTTFPDGRQSVEVVTDLHKETPLRKEFMQLIFPILTKKITDAFSTPADFCQKGLYLELYNDFRYRDQPGIINNFTTRKFDSYGKNLLQKLSDTSQKLCVGAMKSLKLHLNETKARGELTFNLDAAYSNQQYTLTGFVAADKNINIS